MPNSQLLLVICSIISKIKYMIINNKFTYLFQFYFHVHFFKKRGFFFEELHFLEKMKSIIDDLNVEQKAAVTASFDEPLFVYAGAGSGKTRTLICRIANMIFSGINPANILAITFTKKASEEIRERLKQFVGPRAAQVVTFTFHQLCLKILRDNPFILNFSQDNFKIADSSVQAQIIKNACKNLIGNNKKVNPNALRIMTSKMLNFVKRAKTLFKKSDDFQNDLRTVFQFYQDQLKEHRLIDFFDFLTFTENLLKRYPRIAYEYRKLYQYILIDEFQDTSAINFQIIKLILGSQSKRITIVGDVRQSIYGFRGANPNNIGTFLSCYPNANRVVLNQNYRSTQTILNAAQSLISNCKTDIEFSSPLISKRPKGDLVKIIKAEDSLSEVDQICTEIEKLVYPGSTYQYRDIVIMFRVKKISSDIEMELFRRNIPYTHKRGVRFFMRRDIREVIAYSRLILSYNEDGPDPNMLISEAVETVINVPDRKIGEKVIKNIREKAQAENKSMLTIIKNLKENDVGKIVYKRLESFIELIEKMYNQIIVLNSNLSTDYALQLIIDLAGLLDENAQGEIEGSSTVDDIEELNDALTDYINNRKETFDILIEEAKRFHKQLIQTNYCKPQDNNNSQASQALSQQLTSANNLRKFINAITLESVGEMTRNAVTLSTIHQMKGLESPICFLMRFNLGVLPVNDKTETECETEGFETVQTIEEERRIAYVAMTRAKEKLFISMCLAYKGKRMEPSPFLYEIDNRCLTDKSQNAKHREEVEEMMKFLDDNFDDIEMTL